MTSNPSQPDKNNTSNTEADTTASKQEAPAKPETADTQKASTAQANTQKANTVSRKSPKAPTVTAEKVKTPLSKTAVLALLIALIGTAGVVTDHLLSKQEIEKLKAEIIAQQSASKQTLTNQLSQLNQQTITKSAQAIKSALSEQSDKVEQRLQTRFSAQEKQLSERINELSSQAQPQDWLVEEAEYLMRLAGRTLWLEKNTETAAALLQDADSRLAQLDKPELLPVRQAIHVDIEKINALPKLNLDDITLSLMALEQQASNLKLANIELPEAEQAPADAELSEDIADWRTNLKKSWDKFLEDFITIRRRSGATEALMAPSQQQNLRFNMALKLQQAQWAVTRQNQALYQQTLASVNSWLNDYYDMADLGSQHFATRINELSNQMISADYPKQLTSLNTMRSYLNQVVPAPVNTPEAPAPKKSNTESEPKLEAKPKKSENQGAAL